MNSLLLGFVQPISTKALKVVVVVIVDVIMVKVRLHMAADHLRMNTP